MGLGLKRDAWLRSQAAHDDEPVSLGHALAQVVELLKNPASVKALAVEALKAQAVIDGAKQVEADLAAAKDVADAGVDKAKAEIAKLYAAHEARVAKREAELVDREKQVANLLALAKTDAGKAAADRAEAKRRLDRVEAAVSGAA